MLSLLAGLALNPPVLPAVAGTPISAPLRMSLDAVSAQPGTELWPAPDPEPADLDSEPGGRPSTLKPLLPRRLRPERLEGEIVVPQEVRPLPGQLDQVAVFNSNNPEIISGEGILLSSFPPTGMAVPKAHLNYAFNGRFDIFSHHITRARDSSQTRTLFQGILVYNPSRSDTISLAVRQAASYLTRPDAIYNPLPSYLEDPVGQAYSGPGSRVVNDLLRGRRQGLWPAEIQIPPGQVALLMSLPIPVGNVTPTSNARSTLARLNSSGPVYVATVAVSAPLDPYGQERPPTLDDYLQVLTTRDLVRPRDRQPTPPEQLDVYPFIYGRVSGIARGSLWQADLTDPGSRTLAIPAPGGMISYPISTLPRGTLGTGQVQSAPLLARYPESAYAAHGNYGIEYDLTLPLVNRTNAAQTVALRFQTPLKQDQGPGLRFLTSPQDRVFYRGPLRLDYTDERGNPQTRYLHIVQNRGQQGDNLLQLTLLPNQERKVRVRLLYPADATPPQVLTIATLDPITAMQSRPVLSDRP